MKVLSLSLLPTSDWLNGFDLGKGGVVVQKTNNELEAIIDIVILILVIISVNSNNKNNNTINIIIMRKGEAMIGKVNMEKETEF